MFNYWIPPGSPPGPLGPCPWLPSNWNQPVTHWLRFPANFPPHFCFFGLLELLCHRFGEKVPGTFGVAKQAQIHCPAPPVCGVTIRPPPFPHLGLGYKTASSFFDFTVSGPAPSPFSVVCLPRCHRSMGDAPFPPLEVLSEGAREL